MFVSAYEHQQLRFRNQLNAIMNRNDETKLLTEAEKEARTAARTAGTSTTGYRCFQMHETYNRRDK